MQLEQFLRRHYDDYVYIRKSDGTAIMDIMVKFVPLWILETYGQCEIDVIERPAGESPKFMVYDLMCFKRCKEQDK